MAAASEARGSRGADAGAEQKKSDDNTNHKAVAAPTTTTKTTATTNGSTIAGTTTTATGATASANGKAPAPAPPVRRQSQHSDFAKAMMSTRLSSAATATASAAAMSPSSSSSSPSLAPVSDRDGEKNLPDHDNTTTTTTRPPTTTDHHHDHPVTFAVPKLPRDREHHHDSHLHVPRIPPSSSLGWALHGGAMGAPEGVGLALSDTPAASTPSTAPGSPRILPIRQNSGSSTPRVRPPATTLNIPGMTRSRISPDGKIAQRDVGAKLVIIMVGLPARGKSYITRKLQRYLSWQQHEARVFNVGNRRRVVAGSVAGLDPPRSPKPIDAPTQAAHILLNGVDPMAQGAQEAVADEEQAHAEPNTQPRSESMDQSALFFDPNNARASKIREQVAMETLEELLDFLLDHGGSVGILDATNSTIERRQKLFDEVKRREPKLGILFIESVCEDQKLLEINMRLKLRGPDYRGKDPETSYLDFKKRVEAYESAYVPIGKYEEDHHMQYIKMIDVGKKVIHHQLQGFLTSGIASYLSTFNLSPRQIWITRHGKSVDNVLGKIGGNSDLTPEGRDYGTVLYNFICHKRKEWEADQKARAMEGSSLPPKPGDHTPPYPELLGELEAKNFCVWTSMLKRSIQTAADFDEDEDFDVKNWEMLNELNAGSFEGLTYEEIEAKYPDEYGKRAKDKLHYIYPGVGGEGYLQIISRLRDMVRELERIKDHVLIVGHRSICRVLMAYFMDLTRDDIADLDMPLGMLYAIEPKPYGIDFHAYRYNQNECWFDELPGYMPQKETKKGN